MPIFDIFLLEAVLNGLLFGGVLALLALGLNLIFGVIDVVWICYAELMMIGMYAVYFLSVVYGVPLLVAFALCVLLIALLGGAAPLPRDPADPRLRADQPAPGHRRRPVLPAGARDAPVRRRLRNLGISLPSVMLGDIFLATSRLYAAAPR